MNRRKTKTAKESTWQKVKKSRKVNGFWQSLQKSRNYRVAKCITSKIFNLDKMADELFVYF